MAYKHFEIMCIESIPNKRLQPVPHRAVRLGDGFWRPRMAANRSRSIPMHLAAMDAHGFVDNFRRAAGRKNIERRGRYATDADVFKWIEAAAHTLAAEPDAELQERLDAVVQDVIAARGDDGYLNTWHVFDIADQRFTHLDASHEFFNLGHLVEAAIAYQQTTGHAKLLEAACGFADLVIQQFHEREPSGRSGHNGLELAMVALYRVTNDTRYLDFARILIDWSGIADWQEIKGHCVQTTYLCSGVADYCAETGDTELFRVLERLWQDMVTCKLHVHGGIGSRYETEDFGLPYQLPTLYSYSETCASVGHILWNARMLALTRDAQYADLIELILYNALLAGVSLRGGQYFYANPLAARGDTTRRPWHEIPCCPPNIQRLIASLPGYFHSTSDNSVWVHLYDACTLDHKLPDGRAMRIEQQTRYPWDGQVTLTVDIEGDTESSLHLRIPRWSQTPSILLNGQPVSEPVVPGQYLQLRRTWSKDDRIELDLGMPIDLLTSDPRVRDTAGCVAVRRGPLIYCLEASDNPDGSVLSARISTDDGKLQPRECSELFDGVTVIEAEGAYDTSASRDALYSPLPTPKSPTTPTQLTFIPYYAWSNRGPAEMTVWLPTT